MSGLLFENKTLLHAVSVQNPGAFGQSYNNQPMPIKSDEDGVIFTDIVADGTSVTGASPNSDNLLSGDIHGLHVLNFNHLFDGVTWDRFRSLVDNADTIAEGTSGLAGTVARNTLFNGATWDRLRSLIDNADGEATGVTGLLGAVARLSLFNDSTWDRFYGNRELTILASTARTATLNSSDFTNYNAKGAHFIIDVTSITDTPSIVVTISGKDALSGKYYTLLTSNAIVAVGTTVLKVYPGIATVANGAASDILPRTFRVTVTHADADSITYSVGANLVN